MSTTEKLFAVKVFGPNLRLPEADRGSFHVHAADCGDCRKLIAKYGPESIVHVQDLRHLVEYVYPSSDFGYDMDVEDDRAPYVQDIYVAPCLRDLPDGKFGGNPAEKDWEALAEAFDVLGEMLQTHVDLVDPTGKPEWEQMIRDLNNIAARAETALVG